MTDRWESSHVGSPHDDRKSDEVRYLKEVRHGRRLVLGQIGVGYVEDSVRSSLQDLPTQSV